MTITRVLYATYNGIKSSLPVHQGRLGIKVSLYAGSHTWHKNLPFNMQQDNFLDFMPQCADDHISMGFGICIHCGK